MGYIYIIRNKINSKVYIGQTIHSIYSRFRAHIRASEIIDFEKFDYTYKSKIYNAFRKYGVDKFYIELLEECENELLNEREIYYIKYFNSFKNGYNTTLGGDGFRIYSFTKQEEQEIIKLYKDSKSIRKVSEQLGCSVRPVQEILLKYNIEITDNSIKIIMYDKLFNPLGVFNSIEESRKFIIKHSTYESIDVRNYYRLLHKSFENGSIAYNHRWQLASDLIHEDKIFRTKFDKEAYIEGKPAYQPEGKNYWVVDNSLDKIVIESINVQFYCKICGKVISKGANLCLDCHKKQTRKNIPDLKTLEELILIHSYEEIGRKYGVTGKAVRKWCDSYGIKRITFCENKPSNDKLLDLSDKYTDEVIGQMYNVAGCTVKRWREKAGILKNTNVQVTCKELGITFDSYRDAARYCIEKGITHSNSVHNLAYRINKSKGTGKRILGYTWI